MWQVWQVNFPPHRYIRLTPTHSHAKPILKRQNTFRMATYPFSPRKFPSTILQLVLFALVFLLCALFPASRLSAQQTEFTRPTLIIQADKKPVHYANQARKAMKRGDTLTAIVYATHYLTIARTRRQKRKAAESMTELFPFLNRHQDPLSALLESSRVVLGEREFRLRQTVLAEYEKRDSLRAALDRCPPDRIKDIGMTDIANAQLDYDAELEGAKQSIDTAAGAIADYYFLLGESLPNGTNRLAALKKAKRYDQALYFNPRHKGALVARKRIAAKADGIYALAPLRNQSGTHLGDDVFPALFATALGNGSSINYFRR